MQDARSLWKGRHNLCMLPSNHEFQAHFVCRLASSLRGSLALEANTFEYMCTSIQQVAYKPSNFKAVPSCYACLYTSTFHVQPMFAG